MSNAQKIYSLSLDQIANAILVGGSKRSVLVQGHMGTGKSSLLKMLGKSLPEHDMLYCDCTTKDLGDITVPEFHKIDGNGFVRYVTNEELGLHLSKPIILMIDEFGKANPSVKNALLRLILERKMGSYTMHDTSLLFLTTNFGSEGVGDILPPHARNRISIVPVRKPTAEEWIEWGIDNGIDTAMLGFVKEFPQVFQSFEDVKNPEDNEYIYHPKSMRTSFVTPRSLEAASDWLKVRHSMDSKTLTSLLIGTIGERAAKDLASYIALADQLPTLQSIKDNPQSAKVPESVSAVCMIIYRTLAIIERDWIDAWMEYLVRLTPEAQAMFANGVRAEKYTKKSMVMTNKKFTAWALNNNFMFAADKK